MQTPFLKQVAEYYLRQEHFSELCFVFPSKRAQKFFLHYLEGLCQERGQVIFAPQCTTVNEFLLSLKPKYRVLDKTELLFRLYDCRIALRGSIRDEGDSFDDFLFWGNIMLSDFDLIDRYLVDAYQLYRNIEGLKELEQDQLSFLSEETQEAIRQYFNYIDYKKSESYQSEQTEDSYLNKYMLFWESLYELYTTFREQIALSNEGYEGYIYREIAEDKALIDTLQDKHQALIDEGVCPIVFVGLFELSTSEKQLMKGLSKRRLAEFVWDEAVAVAQEEKHPVARILRDNISALGRVAMDRGNAQELSHYLPKHFRIYECASTVSQVKALNEVLKRIHQETRQGQRANHEGQKPQAPKELDTLVVLPDEQLLIPVVGSLPNPEDEEGQDKACRLQHINISMGYPLNRTSVATLISRWLRMLPTNHQGAYAVPSIVNLLSLQILTEHYPGLHLISTALRKQKNYMLSGGWIVDTLIPNRLEKLTKAGDIEIAQELENCRELLSILLKPETEALPFLRQLDRLLILLVEPMLKEHNNESAKSSETTSEQDEQPTPNEGKTKPIDFELTFLMHYQRLTRRLITLLEPRGGYALSCQGAIHLLEGLSRNLTIPFKGDPLNGLQIMGTLESRCLHFPNVIYISAQEGKLPKRKHSSTFIPNVLRYAYGLPTPELDDASESYRFYQSIAQCEKLIMMVGEEDSLRGKGEESRYIAQLSMLYNLKPKRLPVELPPETRSPQELTIAKDSPEIKTALEQWLHPTNTPFEANDKCLSASNFNTYLQCPLKFYYQYIRGIKETEEPEQMLSPSDYGTILHDTLDQEIYNVRCGTEITREFIEQHLALGVEHLCTLVQKVYVNHLSRNSQKRQIGELDSYHIHLIATQIESVLKFDLGQCPFVYLHSEAQVRGTLPLDYMGEERHVRFKGYIDRIDMLRDNEGDCVRILDYKTGKDENKSIASIAKLFAKPSEHKAQIQTLLYCELLRSGIILSEQQGDKHHSSSPSHPEPNYRTARLHAGLLITRRLAGYEQSYNPLLMYSTGNETSPLQYDEVREEYLHETHQKLSELFDLSKPFTQTSDKNVCKYCPFAVICHKEGQDY